MKKNFVYRDTSIKKAIEVLNDFKDLKVVLVVDKKLKLLGTITDGDVRRGILKGFKVEEPVDKIMHRKFKFIREGDETTNKIEKLKKMQIKQIPILDQNDKVLKILKLDQINQETNKEVIVFIMAGGLGKRLRPLTNKIPKPLVTVGSKPIIKILIEKFRQLGFLNFFISVFFKSSDIKKSLGGGDKNYTIKYIEEQNPLGTAGSLSKIKKTNLKGPIIVINADILTNIDFNELLNYHKINNSDITVCVRQYSLNIPFGVVESENKKISIIDEKPNKNFFVNAGIYVLEKKIVQKLQNNKKIDMPDFINSLVKKKKVLSFPIFEDWHDIGQIKELIEVRKLYSKNH